MDSRKPLTAERIEEIRESLTTPNADGNIWLDEVTSPDELLSILSLLTPPPDAAVREAVEQVDGEIRVGEKVGLLNDLLSIPVEIKTLRTLLRAVQSPRLTGEQVEAVRDAHVCATDAIAARLRAAFPEAFYGEVGR